MARPFRAIPVLERTMGRLLRGDGTMREARLIVLQPTVTGPRWTGSVRRPDDHRAGESSRPDPPRVRWHDSRERRRFGRGGTGTARHPRSTEKRISTNRRWATTIRSRRWQCGMLLEPARSWFRCIPSARRRASPRSRRLSASARVICSSLQVVAGFVAKGGALPSPVIVLRWRPLPAQAESRGPNGCPLRSQ